MSKNYAGFGLFVDGLAVGFVAAQSKNEALIMYGQMLAKGGDADIAKVEVHPITITVHNEEAAA
jgi:hypothetical protein